MKKPLTKLLLLILLPTMMLQISCGLSSLNHIEKKAIKAEQKKEYKEAIDHYLKYIARSKDKDKAIVIARKIYNLSHLVKNYNSASIKSLNFIIVAAKSSTDRLWAQFNLAKFYFHKKSNYKISINKFSKFIELNKDKKQNDEARVYIAKSYFYLNQFYQSLVEVNTLLDSKNVLPKVNYEALLVKANIYQSQKKLNKASNVFKKAILKFPKMSVKNQVHLSLVMVLEESKKYEEAIKILSSVVDHYSNKNFIMEKIHRLEYQKSQLPGARGKMK